MNILSMPFVDILLSKFCTRDLSNVRVIGVQHILETTHAMFQYLYRYGLKPQNVSLLGKCYSTCKDVFDEMKEDGIDVSPGSFSYQSHKPFDALFNNEVHTFLRQRLPDLLEGDYEAIVVLDDGGKCINVISKFHDKLSSQIVAIEQTSAGYHDIKDVLLPFPVINVARSPIKLIYESPMIAQAGAERLYQSLRAKNIYSDSVLIIGGGAIGQAMKTRLEGEMAVSIYDASRLLSDFNKKISDVLPAFDLIIGCTGRPSIAKENHKLLSQNAVLVSMSSSDREFDSVHLRKRISSSSDCHQDLLIGNRLLVNSGFPVNFDGDRENIDTEKIQLTIALIAAGMLQALEPSSYVQNQLLPLEQKYEELIKSLYLEDPILVAN